MRPSQSIAPTSVFSTCPLSVEKLWSKNKIGQRGEKMQKGRKTVKQDKIVLIL